MFLNLPGKKLFECQINLFVNISSFCNYYVQSYRHSSPIIPLTFPLKSLQYLKCLLGDLVQVTRDQWSKSLRPVRLVRGCVLQCTSHK